jgi:hypothetical protein
MNVMRNASINKPLPAAAVTDGLVGAGATRPTWLQIRAHLATGCGMPGVAP